MIWEGVETCSLSVLVLLVRTTLISAHGIIETFEGLKCKSGDTDISYQNVSYSACLDECRARGLCTSVSYRPISHTCLVHGADAVEKSPVECSEFVYSEKSSWHESSISCGNNRCDRARSTCSTETEACQYEDCPMHPVSSGDLLKYGNTRTAGAKVAYRCSRYLALAGAQQRSCQVNGQWDSDLASCQATTTTVTTTTVTPPSTTVTGQAGGTCDADWQLNQGSCYHINTVPLTFDQAKDYCLSVSSKVAVPNSQDKNQFIKSILSDPFYWIGVTLNLPDGWQDVDGTLLTFNDWVGGAEPGSALQPCAIFSSSISYQWTAWQCTASYPTVCEKLVI